MECIFNYLSEIVYWNVATDVHNNLSMVDKYCVVHLYDLDAVKVLQLMFLTFTTDE